MKFKNMNPADDGRIALTNGHITYCPYNEWTELAPVYHETAIRRGFISEEAVRAAGSPDDSPPPLDASTRKQKIVDAIHGMLEGNNEGDFTATGLPQLGALRAASGLHDITAEERDSVWAEVEQHLEDGDEPA